MKSHKMTIVVWFVVNLFLFQLVSHALSVSAESGWFVEGFWLALYVYVFLCLWKIFNLHINDVNVINGVKNTERNKLLAVIDAIADRVLSDATYWLWLVPLYYWIIRVALLLVGWLATGEWSKFTTCDVIPTTCYFSSNAIGVNKIVNWIAEIDFGLFLLVTFGAFGFVTMMIFSALYKAKSD